MSRIHRAQRKAPIARADGTASVSAHSNRVYLERIGARLLDGPALF